MGIESILLKEQGAYHMDDQEKTTQSAQLSDDTTPALFASARKKQLEQQEKEAQRQAAEAEVRRLELEVEERRLRAEAAVGLPEKALRRAAKEKAKASRKKLSKGAKIAIIVGGIAAFLLLLILAVYDPPPEPNAADIFDASATLADYGMTVKYPSASFYECANDGESLTLATRREGLGLISFTVTDYPTTGIGQKKALELYKEYGSELLKSILADYKDGVVISSRAGRSDSDVDEYIGEGTYIDEDDVSCKVFVRITSRSETGALYSMTVMARDSCYDTCKTLAFRVKNSIKFE